MELFDNLLNHAGSDSKLREEHLCLGFNLVLNHRIMDAFCEFLTDNRFKFFGFVHNDI